MTKRQKNDVGKLLARLLITREPLQLIFTGEIRGVPGFFSVFGKQDSSEAVQRCG